MSIPTPERLVAKLLIARWKHKRPLAQTIPLARRQRDDLAALIDAAGAAASTRVQIRRLPGLEVSSTNHSLAMVAQHLAMTNRDMATIIASLAAAKPPTIDVVIANYKPSPDADAAASMAELDASLEALTDALADLPAIEGATLTHPHPWFGPLSATTWAVFPTFHQQLHLKQAALVSRGLAHG